jgi:hypothetical protein
LTIKVKQITLQTENPFIHPYSFTLIPTTFKRFRTVLYSMLIAQSVACTKEDGETSDSLPDRYNFENVNFTGQSQRISMLYEILAETKKAASETVSGVKLAQMYSNAFNPFADHALNTSGVQLRDQTYTSDVSAFDHYLIQIGETSEHYATTVTGPNQAGTVQSLISIFTKYSVDSNGVQYDQVFKNQLMGAVFYRKVMDELLSKSRLDAADNTSAEPGEGTEMQHLWDEAFGYWGGTTELTLKNYDSLDHAGKVYFWAHYTSKGKAIDLPEKMLNGFIKGRDAINRKEYAARDQAADELKKNFELVVACTYVSYLNQAIHYYGDYATRCHTLSESFGWMMSLKYYTSKTIVQSDFDDIVSAYYVDGRLSIAHFTVSELTAIRDRFSALYGLSAIKSRL